MNVEIYTIPGCRYCLMAKALLKAHGVVYSEIDLDRNPELVTNMTERTGGRTFPQVIIDNRPIGGFEQLRQIMKTSA